MRKSAFQTASYSSMIATLSIACLVTGLDPGTASGQAAAWYGQNRASYGHVPHSRQYGHGYTNNPPAGHYGSPDYVQHPATSQPAVRGSYHHGGYPAAGNWNQSQPGQNQRHQAHSHQQQNQQPRQQLTPIQKAAQQAAQNVSPSGVPVLSPAAKQFFENLRGPNLSTYNQNRQNYSFRGQTRPSTQIPNTTWRSGSRFGQSYSNRSSYNQSTINQNRFNYSLHNLTRPGLRGGSCGAGRAAWNYRVAPLLK